MPPHDNLGLPTPAQVAAKVAELDARMQGIERALQSQNQVLFVLLRAALLGRVRGMDLPGQPGQIEDDPVTRMFAACTAQRDALDQIADMLVSVRNMNARRGQPTHDLDEALILYGAAAMGPEDDDPGVIMGRAQE